MASYYYTPNQMNYTDRNQMGYSDSTEQAYNQRQSAGKPAPEPKLLSGARTPMWTQSAHVSE